MMSRVRLVALNTPMPADPHYSDAFTLDGEQCPVCCELAFDAWERMTYGGISIGPTIAPGFSICLHGRAAYISAAKALNV